jgi:hypothetical protein
MSKGQCSHEELHTKCDLECLQTRRQPQPMRDCIPRSSPGSGQDAGSLTPLSVLGVIRGREADFRVRQLGGRSGGWSGDDPGRAPELVAADLRLGGRPRRAHDPGLGLGLRRLGGRTNVGGSENGLLMDHVKVGRDVVRDNRPLGG